MQGGNVDRYTCISRTQTEFYYNWHKLNEFVILISGSRPRFDLNVAVEAQMLPVRNTGAATNDNLFRT